MKKPTIIILAIIALLLLIFRKVYTHIEGVKNEKLSYVYKLDFKFSTKIDSVGLLNRRNSGLIFFHNVNGIFEESAEDKIKDQLKFNGNLRFILLKPNKALAIMTDTADKYHTGDSIVIDTNSDKITFYRGTKVISENKVSEALNGRPF